MTRKAAPARQTAAGKQPQQQTSSHGGQAVTSDQVDPTKASLLPQMIGNRYRNRPHALLLIRQHALQRLLHRLFQIRQELGAHAVDIRLQRGELAFFDISAERGQLHIHDIVEVLYLLPIILHALGRCFGDRDGRLGTIGPLHVAMPACPRSQRTA